MSRIVRVVALALPLLLACIIVSAGHWRIHDGQVERVSHVAAPTPVTVPDQAAAQTDQSVFLHHLSPSVPWPVWHC